MTYYRRGTPRERFLAKIEVQADGCWIWTASLDTHGYGQFYDGKKLRKAYRVAYELYVGPVPEGLQLDHLCRVRRCVNPSHLEPVTQAENLRRGALARTHCKHGHPFAGENLAILNGRWRRCRICARATVYRFRERARTGS